MIYRRFSLFLWLSGPLIAIMMIWVGGVESQCGSESSSCKNCHEVQAQSPVNHDGTSWHEAHAFGDFCYICHAGNQQAPAMEAAHQGMVPPLSDVQASCQSCHPSDLAQRAEVYTNILGVSFENSSTSELLATLTTTPLNQTAPSTEEASTTVVPVTNTSTVCAPSSTQLVVDDPNLVDFAHHYNQVVLGEQPVNGGNIALVGMISVVVLGGGGFVIFNEARLHNAAAQTERIEGEFPADVIELLPALTNLKAQSRKSLKQILNHPDKSDQVLGLIDAVIRNDDPSKE